MPNGGNELQYDLPGDGIHITYSQFTGPEHSSQTLSYQGPDGDRSFSGNDIRSQGSDLGALLTVTLHSDTGEETKLTLLLPNIDWGNDWTKPTRRQPIQTLAIWTSSINPTSGQHMDRQLLTYQVYHLQGTVSLRIEP